MSEGSTHRHGPIRNTNRSLTLNLNLQMYEANLAAHSFGSFLSMHPFYKCIRTKYSRNHSVEGRADEAGYDRNREADTLSFCH